MISRVVFYSGVFFVLWLMGRVTPQAGDSGREWTDEELGVAKIYIASPVWPAEALARLGR